MIDLADIDYIGLRFIFKDGSYDDCYDPVEKDNTYIVRDISGVPTYVVLGHSNRYVYEIPVDDVVRVEEYFICRTCGYELEETCNGEYCCSNWRCIEYIEEED